jgi:lipopolysaccharide export system protein LptA
MRAATKFTLLLLFSLLVTFSASAQKKGDRLSYESDGMLTMTRVNGKTAYLLTKNARFTQKTMIIHCDSAYLFRADNRLEAFGNVRIIDREDKNSVITSDKLFYDGNKKEAKLRQNVVYKQEGQTLYTDKLDYFKDTKSAYFYDHGKVVDSANVLTSVKGHFEPEKNLVTFMQNVVLVSPDKTIKTEHLVYNTKTKIAITKGYTKITGEDGNVVESDKGLTYNTTEENTTLLSGTVETESYILKGDKLDFDQVKKIHTVTKNVELVSKEDEVIIFGDKAKAWKEDGITKIWGNTLMKKPFEDDTLYMSADTLVSIDSQDETKKKILAYGKVKIFKKDLQGIADSLTYNFADSTINFHEDPVLWTGKNQLEADNIHALIKNSKLDKMLLKANSFVINEDTLGNYNQVKGRDMTIHVVEEELRKVDVNGNSETIYFAVNEAYQLIGMNKLLSSDIVFRFKNKKVDNITFFTKPDGKFTPPHEMKEPDTKLKNFSWRVEEKPTLEQLLGVRNMKQATKKTMPEQNKKQAAN